MNRNDVNSIDTISKELKRSFFHRNQQWFVINLILRLTMGVTDIILSYSLMQIIDTALSGSMYSFLKTVTICVVTICINSLSFYFMRYTFAKFLQNGASRYKETIVEKLFQKSISTFRTEGISTYLSALTNDVTSMEAGYYERLFVAVTSIVTFFAALFIMLRKSVLLTIIAIVFMMVPLVISLLSGKKLAYTEKDISNQNEMFTSTTKDLLDGFSIIKSFKIEKHAIRQFYLSNKSLESAKYERRLIVRLIEMLDDFAGTVSQFGVFICGAYLVVTGEGVTAGTITMFLQMMNYLNEPLNTLPPILASKKASDALIGKMAEILSRTDGGDAGKYTWNSPFAEEIQLKNLNFGYEESNLVLKDISMDFQKGKSYALVGPSGCGKSTVLNLLMGNVDNYVGSITFDGHELKNITKESLYEKIALVQQNVFIFNDTIKNNITLYRDINETDLNKVIQTAALEELIKKHGLDYDCGENGRNLSGGEKQRISIARCLLSDIDILLLDEATSALDKKTASQVITSIQKIESITRIVVTHQLEPEILNAFDEVVVLHEGKIVERGNYETLIRQKGYLYSLAMLES